MAERRADTVDRVGTLYEHVARSQRVDRDGTIHPPPEAQSTPLPVATGPEVVVGQRVGSTMRAEWFDASQPSLCRQVAVQVPRTSADREALLREARVLARLSHPNVPPVYLSVGPRQLVFRRRTGSLWSTMLDDAMDVEPWAQGREPMVFHLDVWDAVAGAVSFAHGRGVAHQAIAPDRVRVGDFGEVQLGGWGEARALRPDDPDLPASSPHGGERADVQALAAILDRLRDQLQPVGGELLAEVTASPCATVEALRARVTRWRRRRVAFQLRSQGDTRATWLRVQLRSPEPDPVEVERLSTEARFAYRQALKLWPDDAEGAERLDRLLRTLIGYHCDRRQPRAARGLLAQIGHDDALLRRVVAVEEELAVVRAELGALSRLAQSESSLEGAFPQAVTSVVMAGVVWLLCAGLQVATELGLPVGYPLVLTGLATFVLAGLILVVVTHASQGARTSRRLFGTGTVALVGASAGWLVCMAVGAPIRDALGLHAMIAAAVFGTTGLTFDRAMLPSPLIYVATAVAVATLPYSWLVFGTGNALAMLAFALVSVALWLRAQ